MSDDLPSAGTYLAEGRATAARPHDERVLRSGHPGDERARSAGGIEPPSVPDGTFIKVAAAEHPLPRACEVAVYFQDYHRSSSKLGRFGKIVGIDAEGGEYLVMLDNFESVTVPMRRVEWRKAST